LRNKELYAKQNAKLNRLPQRGDFMLTRMLAEKERFVFLQKTLPRKDEPILETCKANHDQNRSHATKPNKTTANRNAR